MRSSLVPPGPGHLHLSCGLASSKQFSHIRPSNCSKSQNPSSLPSSNPSMAPHSLQIPNPPPGFRSSSCSGPDYPGPARSCHSTPETPPSARLPRFPHSGLLYPEHLPHSSPLTTPPFLQLGAGPSLTQGDGRSSNSGKGKGPRARWASGNKAGFFPLRIPSNSP